MSLARCLIGVLLVVGSTIATSAKPAHACSCLGDPIQAAETVGLPDLVFTGSVSDSGPSNVTAEWSRPPQPGLALLFEVEEVRLGKVGPTVVVHTPGGPANNGNCSIGAVVGLQLVTVHRDEFGQFRGGMCSILPVAQSPDDKELVAVFGPPMAPGADIEPEILTAGVAVPPDIEDIGARQVFDELGGELYFSSTSASRPTNPADERSAGATGAVEVSEEGSSSTSPLWLAVPLLIALTGSIVLVKRRIR